MKLKLIALSALFAAGVFASIAMADGGHHGTKLDGAACQEVHLSGTIAPQTLAVTVSKASDGSLIPAGSQVNLAVGAAGQTVRVKAEACATGTGTALVLTVKQVELRPAKTATETTGTSTEKRSHEGEHGHGTKGTTTATTTTAPATTTAGTTTTP